MRWIVISLATVVVMGCQPAPAPPSIPASRFLIVTNLVDELTLVCKDVGAAFGGWGGGGTTNAANDGKSSRDADCTVYATPDEMNKVMHRLYALFDKRIRANNGTVEEAHRPPEMESPKQWKLVYEIEPQRGVITAALSGGEEPGGVVPMSGTLRPGQLRYRLKLNLDEGPIAK